MSQWSTYNQPDPLVPFNEQRLGTLLRVLKEGASDSADVVARMETLRGWRGDLRWTGDAAEAYFGILGELPTDLSKLIRSYGSARDATEVYLGELRQLRKNADNLLEVVLGYESRLHSLESQRIATPPEDEANRRSIEQEIESAQSSQAELIRGADSIRSEVEAAADRFARSMAMAQELGIHNRSFLERIYEDTIGDFIDTAIWAWEKVSLVVGVVGLVCLVIPGLQPLGVVLTVASRMAFVMRTVDILLSDDDADFAYGVDALLVTFGTGAKVGRHLVDNPFVVKGYSVGVSEGSKFFYRSVDVSVSAVEKARDIGHGVYDLVTAPDVSTDAAAPPEQGASPQIGTELTDDIWTLDGLQILPLYSSPMLLEIEVDMTPNHGE